MIFVIGNKHLNQDNKGFTLLELLIVMAIMGIFIVGAIPSFKGTYKTFKLDTSASQLASFITYARQKAILERVNYRLNFDYQGTRYWLTIEQDPVNYPNYYLPAKILGKNIHYLPEEISINSYFDFITFYPDGKVDKDTLILRNEDLDECLVHIRRKINYVKITQK